MPVASPHPSDASGKPRLLPVLWPTSYKLDIFMILSSGSINILAKLIELRKTVLTVYWFIIKCYIKDMDEHPDGRDT